MNAGRHTSTGTSSRDLGALSKGAKTSSSTYGAGLAFAKMLFKMANSVAFKGTLFKGSKSPPVQQQSPTTRENSARTATFKAL